MPGYENYLGNGIWSHNTGLGKTLDALSWCQHAAERALIVAPLAVARQTVQEGAKWGIPVTYARGQGQAAPTGITVTNFEMVRHFDPAAFGAVVIDESSILADHTSQTNHLLIDMFRDVPMRLCCSATPAPNAIEELGNHAEFLGVMTLNEMRATFFYNDDTGWKLKPHSRQHFWHWLASWAMSLKRPSDLGYDDGGYALPPLSILPAILPTDYRPDGRLFAATLKGITERSTVRRATLGARVKAAADLIRAEPDEQWLAWVGLNDEGTALARLLPDAVLIEGKDSPDRKADVFVRFAAGEIRCLITKATIAALGMNFQRCARQVFVGLGDSYLFYYQAIRRSWRFGQQRPVNVHIVLTEPEEVVYHNVLRKEREAIQVGKELMANVAAYEREEVRATRRESTPYVTNDASGQDWRLLLGDSAERLAELADESVDLAVYSPPFQDLFVYSASERDLGNSRTPEEFWRHFDFIIRQMYRVTKPGRTNAVHVADIPALKERDGRIGLKDFPGATIRAYEAAGWTFYSRVTIKRNPQFQAKRTHSHGLSFASLHRDSGDSRVAISDYILVFHKPGERAAPVKTDIDNETWIDWASNVWEGIRESHTLNAAEARDPDDTKHICPLQLDTIERCVRLWSNPGELVLSPFAGIGSEGVVSIEWGRRFVGVELNERYWQTACRNLQRVEFEKRKPSLFDIASIAG